MILVNKVFNVSRITKFKLIIIDSEWRLLKSLEEIG